MEDELQFDMSWKFTWPPQHLDSAALKGVPWGSGATVLGHHPKFPKSGYQTDLRPVVHSLFFHLDNLRSLLHMPTSVFHYAQMAERLALHVLSDRPNLIRTYPNTSSRVRSTKRFRNPIKIG